MVERLFLAVPWGCLRFVIVVFPDHTHLLFLLYLFFIKSVLIYQTLSRCCFIINTIIQISLKQTKCIYRFYELDPNIDCVL